MAFTRIVWDQLARPCSLVSSVFAETISPVESQGCKVKILTYLSESKF